MKKLIIDDLSAAFGCIESAKTKIEEQKSKFDNSKRYIEILDMALNNVSVVSDAIQIEEKLRNNPELASKLLPFEK